MKKEKNDTKILNEMTDGLKLLLTASDEFLKEWGFTDEEIKKLREICKD